MKSPILHTVWCCISGETTGWIFNRSLMVVKWLILVSDRCLSVFEDGEIKYSWPFWACLALRGGTPVRRATTIRSGRCQCIPIASPSSVSIVSWALPHRQDWIKQSQLTASSDRCRCIPFAGALSSYEWIFDHFSPIASFVLGCPVTDNLNIIYTRWQDRTHVFLVHPACAPAYFVFLLSLLLFSVCVLSIYDTQKRILIVAYFPLVLCFLFPKNEYM